MLQNLQSVHCGFSTQGSLPLPLSLHLAHAEWLSKIAIILPHAPRFWPGEDTVCYILKSIRKHNKKVKNPNILTLNYKKKLVSTKIHLHSTHAK